MVAIYSVVANRARDNAAQTSTRGVHGRQQRASDARAQNGNANAWYNGGNANGKAAKKPKAQQAGQKNASRQAAWQVTGCAAKRRAATAAYGRRNRPRGYRNATARHTPAERYRTQHKNRHCSRGRTAVLTARAAAHAAPKAPRKCHNHVVCSRQPNVVRGEAGPGNQLSVVAQPVAVRARRLGAARQRRAVSRWLTENGHANRNARVARRRRVVVVTAVQAATHTEKSNRTLSVGAIRFAAFAPRAISARRAVAVTLAMQNEERTRGSVPWYTQYSEELYITPAGGAAGEGGTCRATRARGGQQQNVIGIAARAAVYTGKPRGRRHIQRRSAAIEGASGE